jgi:chitinase
LFCDPECPFCPPCVFGNPDGDGGDDDDGDNTSTTTSSETAVAIVFGELVSGDAFPTDIPAASDFAVSSIISFSN